MQELGSAPYPFTLIVSLGWVALFLLIGVVLRSTVPFCRKYLMPACMVGGLVGCVAANSGILHTLGPFAPDTLTLQMIIYHLYNMTFVCFGLTGFGVASQKGLMRNTVRLSFLTTSVAHAQCAIGILLIAGYNLVFGTTLLESVGHLMDKGFSSGPGPAMAVGAAWEQAGFANMVSLGLAFAATGYIASIIFGIPAANYIMRKKGQKSDGITATVNEQKGIYPEGECPPAGSMRFMVSNIDTMAFQVALIALGYFLAFALITGLTMLFPIPPKIMGMMWSLFAVVFCLPAGLIMRELVLKRLFRAQQLFDQGCHNRILNVFVDLVAVSALVGIEIGVVREWWTIILIGSVGCGVITLVYLWALTRKNLDFAEERFLGLLGLSTGTITSGLVLVRMVDPEYKSTVPYELGLMALPSLVFSIPLMIIVTPLLFGQVYYGTSWTTPLFACIGVVIVFTGIAMLPFWKINGKVAKF